MIAVLVTDYTYSGSVIDMIIDDACAHTERTKNGYVHAGLNKDSYINGTINVDIDGLQLYGEAYLDTYLNIKTGVEIDVGLKAFGHCNKLGQDTIDLDLSATG